jgi:hypothetical protein
MNIYYKGLSIYCFHLFNLIINLTNFKAFIAIFIDFIYKFLYLFIIIVNFNMFFHLIPEFLYILYLIHL